MAWVLDTVRAAPLLSGCVAFQATRFLFEDVYVALRQRSVVRPANLPPTLKDVLDVDEMERARRYALDSNLFGILHDAFEFVSGTALLLGGAMPFAWHLAGTFLPRMGMAPATHPIAHSLVFFTGITLFGFVTDLPWSYARAFWLEERHGFNNQTIGFFFKDQLRQFAIFTPLSAAAVAVLLRAMQFTGPRMPLYVWSALFAFSLVVITVYPEYIAPLIDKYIELPPSPLRTAVQGLARRVNFPLTKLYLVAGSVRSAHSNAYFYGFFNNKRIVLFDTLVGTPAAEGLEEAMADAVQAAGGRSKTRESSARDGKGCTVPQIVAVVAHELGHWAHSHVLRMFALQQALTLLQFSVFAELLQYGPLYKEFGFGSVRPPFIGFLLVFTYVFAPLNSVVQLGTNAFVRHNEYQADAYAADLDLATDLRSALLKLHSDNGGFPVHDWLHSLMHRSHPTLLERLEALEGVEEKAK